MSKASEMSQIPEKIKQHLPDASEAERFIELFAQKTPSLSLFKDKALLADVLTLVSFSPFLGTVILQNLQHVSWLARQKKEPKTRDKEELLESLARFSMMNLDLSPTELLSKFKEREFLRIYLSDIRELKTIAEITEEISDLADAIFEYALRLACQEIDNRYGIPLETDAKGKTKKADFCVVALGKLGSKELNYVSDVDLMFLYSADGATSGTGSKGVVTNREYFVKLSEFVTKIVSGGLGRGGAYKIDLRLRPYGKVGAIALSLSESISYYSSVSQAWERQALIRARPCAGNFELFRDFYEGVVDLIFPKQISVQEALQNVRRTKEKINLEHGNSKGYNVKLGKGGIREIEFIAQALQVAYGGQDLWLRAPHTLIALSRLADRELISTNEFRQLSDAYSFLRRLEHRLQMEQGLQTHTIPTTAERKEKLARKMNCSSATDFDEQLHYHTQNVSGIFNRIFGEESKRTFPVSLKKPLEIIVKTENELPPQVLAVLGEEKLSDAALSNSVSKDSLKRFCLTSPYLAQMLISSDLIKSLPTENQPFRQKNYVEILRSALNRGENFAERLSLLRRQWAKLYLEIAAFDIFGKIDLTQSKLLQTELADASVKVALETAKEEICTDETINVFALGKLGGKGMDYGSDLDIVFVSNDSVSSVHQKICEIFVKLLSDFTREGNLYRIDLRLRPYGNDGAICLTKDAFLEYLELKSAIWEWLAYVKLRSVTSEGKQIEATARNIIHQKAKSVSVGALKEETLRIRRLLEQQKCGDSKKFNIKFSSGGKLDVYFAMRFLQLRDSIPDDEENRSTVSMLEKLHIAGSLDRETFETLKLGYEFLNRLDHNLRITVGPTNHLPSSNPKAMKTIVERMNLSSSDELEEKLLLHRLSIHQAFEKVMN